MADKAKNEKPVVSKKAAEEIVNGFNALRNDQRRLTQKITELEADRGEHNLVINTLKDTDPARRCYRLVGGILVERTVAEVLPALQKNVEQIDKIITTLNKQSVAKGEELVEYREKHNIRIAGSAPKKDDAESEDKDVGSKGSNEATSVLVDSAAEK